MIEIKKCIKSDSTTISNLSNTIWHECYKDMLSLEQRIYMLEKFLNPSQIEKQIDAQTIFYFVYFNGELAGYFAYIDQKEHIYLSKLYILDKFRGNKIFNFILDYLYSYKKDIKLNTCKYNPTLKIYLHVGFEIIDEKYNDIGNNFAMDDYILLKKYK